MSAVPWMLILKAGAVLTVAGFLWWAQGRIRVSYTAERERDAAVANLNTYRASVEEQARKDSLQRERDQARDQVLTARLDRLSADNLELRRLLARLAPTVEKPDANGLTRVAINPDWWLCLGTAIDRSPEARAACEASAGAAGLPDAVGD